MPLWRNRSDGLTVSAVLFLQNDGCGRCCHADDHCREKNVGCGRCGLVFVINVLYYVDAHSVPALFRRGSGDGLYCVLSGSDPDYVGLVEPVGIALAVRVIDLRVVPAGPVVEVRPRVAARSG